MSARRIASVLHNAFAPRQISIACGTSVLLPAAAISCLGAFQPPAVTAVSRSSSPAAEKLHKAQTQRFRAVSSASALYPEHPSVSRPSKHRACAPLLRQLRTRVILITCPAAALAVGVSNKQTPGREHYVKIRSGEVVATRPRSP